MTNVTVNLNDTFQWKNSSQRIFSYGAGLNYNNTSDDTDRDTNSTTKLFDEDQLAKLSDLVCQYYDHFATGITISNRETIREYADCFWTYAKEELYDALEEQADAIADEERRRLEEELCSRITTLNSIAGTTRGCFPQTVIAKTLSDNATQMAAMRAEANLNARTLEAQTVANAFDRAYAAYIQGDEADFGKYSNLLQVLRGACATEDVEDNIARDISELGVTAKFNQSVANISDTSGDYIDDSQDVVDAGSIINDILAAAAAAGGI